MTIIFVFDSDNNLLGRIEHRLMVYDTAIELATQMENSINCTIDINYQRNDILVDSFFVTLN